MKKVYLGILLGVVAGIIDVIPMIIQKLSWAANISAFIFWVVVGFFIACVDIKLKGVLKGVIISIILLIPLVPIIGWQDPVVLVPIIIMNLILGSALGFFIDKYGR
ncbi:hypothetical protein KKD84_03975 [Patescibacteria group bacterium]|nr:hypothetical protein [Patescibacteria group bacterium]